MSPLPTSCLHETEDSQPTPNAYHHLSERGNLNPFHYLTLPLKSNWDKVGPFMEQYNRYARIAFIILGGLGAVVMLDNHNWKLPRWPWARDGRDNPPPSFVHQNELHTVDQLAEIKLMEVLKEMSMDEIEDDGPWEDLSGEDENKTMEEAEEQFMGDTQEGVTDILDEMQIGNQR
jgi:hypothetical protein